jgi:hypothetical protein
MSETSNTATTQPGRTPSQRDQRGQRYREIASILWDERVLFL